MDFETRMRKVIKDLVGPLLDRQQEDRESLLVIKKTDAKTEERLVALETIVFKDANISTMVDDLRLRIEEGEALIRKEVSEVRDSSDNRFAAQSERLS
jgi:hypothetical protein